jgi:hypothetical protein
MHTILIEFLKERKKQALFLLSRPIATTTTTTQVGYAILCAVRVLGRAFSLAICCAIEVKRAIGCAIGCAILIKQASNLP